MFTYAMSFSSRDFFVTAPFNFFFLVHYYFYHYSVLDAHRKLKMYVIFLETIKYPIEFMQLTSELVLASC